MPARQLARFSAADERGSADSLGGGGDMTLCCCFDERAFRWLSAPISVKVRVDASRQRAHVVLGTCPVTRRFSSARALLLFWARLRARGGEIMVGSYRPHSPLSLCWRLFIGAGLRAGHASAGQRHARPATADVPRLAPLPAASMTLVLRYFGRQHHSPARRRRRSRLDTRRPAPISPGRAPFAFHMPREAERPASIAAGLQLV